MRITKILILLYVTILFSGCVALQPPTINRMEALDNYKYFYITPTQEVFSGAGTTVSGEYYSTSKTINPSDAISGALIKQGYVKLPYIDNNKIDKTFIVNYGESGRRDLLGGLFGYTTEVTIQFVSAIDHQPICVTTAEGFGETDADDIRIAINRAIDALFSNDNYSQKIIVNW